jgi:hypothetical protein
MPDRLDDELADCCAGRNAVYQLAALTLSALWSRTHEPDRNPRLIQDVINRKMRAGETYRDAIYG